MRKISKSILSVFILVPLAGVGILTIMLNWGKGFNPNQAAQQDIYTVSAGNISSTLHLSGKVGYLISEDVVFTANARVQERLVKDGDWVEKGQVLLRLNEEDLKYELENARIKYLNAKERLAEIRDWHNSSTYISSKSQLDYAMARCEEAEKKYKENLELYQAKAISKQELNSSEFDLKRARSDLEVAKAQFAETAAKGDEKALEKARSEFIIADIDFRKAQEAMAHRDILAPVSGVVSIKQSSSSSSDSRTALEKLFSKNTTVSAGDIFVTISDQSILTVDVKVDEFDVYRVKENQPCKICIPALGGRQFSGHVASISPMASENSQAFYLVRCQINQLNPPLRLGMTGQVDIFLEEKRNVLVVPTSALVKKEGVSGVYLAESDPPRFCPVRVGLNNGELAEILNGLSAGQKIFRIVPAKLLTSESNGA